MFIYSDVIHWLRGVYDSQSASVSYISDIFCKAVYNHKIYEIQIAHFFHVSQKRFVTLSHNYNTLYFHVSHLIEPPLTSSLPLAPALSWWLHSTSRGSPCNSGWSMALWNSDVVSSTVSSSLALSTTNMTPWVPR
jgi:hypothetical protein